VQEDKAETTCAEKAINRERETEGNRWRDRRDGWKDINRGRGLMKERQRTRETEGDTVEAKRPIQEYTCSEEEAEGKRDRKIQKQTVRCKRKTEKACWEKGINRGR